MTVQPTRDQLRALAAAATPGPWEFPREILGLPNPSIFAGDPKRRQVAHVALSGGADAAFIAAARTALPALLDALDQAEARIQAVRELHHHDVFRGHLDNGCAICGHDYPCPTIRALDGEQ